MVKFELRKKNSRDRIFVTELQNIMLCNLCQNKRNSHYFWRNVMLLMFLTEKGSKNHTTALTCSPLLMEK